MKNRWAVVYLIFLFFAISAGGVSAQKREPADGENGVQGRKTISDHAGRAGARIHGPVSEVLHQNVQSEQGEDLGEIVDLLVGQDSRIRFFILSHGGFAGIGDRLTPIPWKILTSATRTEEGVFIVKITGKMLKKAPGFDRIHWPNFADPEWQQEINAYYGSDLTPPSNLKFRLKSKNH